ncbi:type II secretion system protein GspG [bacterium]|jgi:hypothetical protein|nr:type II secretion system protein GspG [bacterium]
MPNGKPVILGFVLLALGAIALNWSRHQNRVPVELSTITPSRTISESQDEIPQIPPGRSITLLPGATVINELHQAELSGEDDLQLLDTLLMTYRQAVRDNPTGENYEIVEALTGSNQKSVAVIPLDHSSISSDGELLDRWGSPYHFHSISSQTMEIRSAGPDGNLWTSDDITREE